jgi:hypothetical protein
MAVARRRGAYQLGLAVPVIFTFAIAPFVFLALHLFILVRYDMLAANLRFFCIELDSTVKQEEDRERCRQLLANVEFVIAQTAPRGSPLHSWIFWVWFVQVAISPVAVLLVVQARALRYQSTVVIDAERAVFVAELLLLFWFFYRQSNAQIKARVFGFVPLIQSAAIFLTAGIASWMNFAWLNMNIPARDGHYEPKSFYDKEGARWTPLTLDLDGAAASSE